MRSIKTLLMLGVLAALCLTGCKPEPPPQSELKPGAGAPAEAPKGLVQQKRDLSPQ